MKAVMSKHEKELRKVLTALLAQAGPQITAQVSAMLEGSADMTPDQIAAAVDVSSLQTAIDEVTSILSSAGTASAAEAIKPISAYLATGIVDQVNDGAVAYAKDRAAEMVGKRLTSDGALVENPNPVYAITDSTRDMIARVITEGLADNIGNQAIIDKIETLGFSSARAELISFTEIGNANSNAALEALDGASDSGLTVTKAWLTAGDDRVDEDICEANEDEGEIPVDQAFQSGHMAPLGHPRCRCSLVGTAS